MAPRAHDVDESLVGRHAQGRGQGGQVRQGRTRAGHAGINLHVNARGAPHLPGGGADVGKHPRPGHGDVNIGLDGRSKIGGGGGNPREERGVGARNPGLVEALAQRERFGQLRDPQPVGTALQGRERDGNQAVTVGVGLDGRELERVGCGGAQDAQVMTDSGQVDDRA